MIVLNTFQLSHVCGTMAKGRGLEVVCDGSRQVHPTMLNDERKTDALRLFGSWFSRSSSFVSQHFLHKNFSLA